MVTVPAIVGIGASAGGLEAFGQFLRALPADTGFGFVLVQHLAPAHPSALAEILSRATPLPITEVRDDPLVEPNHVYVIPPGLNMTIVQGKLGLLPRETRGQQRPIDIFFEALAEDQGHRAIGVVLSGSATDGTLGLEAIKAAGGITFAQDDTAQHPSMPRSAVAAGCVDFVLPPDAIAREIARVARHPYVEPPARKDESTRASDVAGIVQLLKQTTGVDFSSYKASTLERRIARRLILQHQESLTEYVEFLERNPAEAAALHHDLLIGVTRFFRDPDAFETLKSAVFPRLLEGRSSDEPLRIWVVGCSTGEEAYSLAIAITEAGAERLVPVQVFATDLSGPRIEKARAGVYPKSSVAHDVTAERLRQFFVEVDGSYQVTRLIRDRCVFAQHNLLVDPPFSRVDLISCRNVLIYLDSSSQRRILPTLHYALKPHGALWLGTSETTGLYGDLFDVLDAKHRIFLKRPGAHLHPVHFPLEARATRHESGGALRQTPTPPDARREAERLLLTRYSPPGVLISDDMQILQVWGDTGDYLSPAPGRASLSLLKMLRPDLLPSVRAAMGRARTAGRRIREKGLRVKSGGGTRDVAVEVIPVKGGASSEAAWLLLFEDRSRAIPPREGTGGPAPETLTTEPVEDEVARLTQELTAAREYLQSVIEQQEAAHEELQASHEEAQSTNEELQSINEELETSKEETQSTNEELSTVNDELNHRNLELARLNNDLTNVLGSVQTAILIIGRDLRLRRFTPAAEKLFTLISTDLGRPIREIAVGLSIPDLDACLTEAIDSLHLVEREVQDGHGRWYLLRIRPYQTLEGQIDGAVLMLVDIDALRRAHEYAEGIVATVRMPLVVLDAHLRVQRASAAFYETFEVTPDMTEGRPLYELGNRQWDLPELRRLLEDILPRDRFVSDYEVTHEFEQLGRRTMLLNAHRLAGVDPDSPLILLAIEDVTIRRELEALSGRRLSELAAADQAKDEFLAMLSHELRNPLNAVRNALQLVMHPKTSGPTVQHAWNVMDRQVTSLTRLVGDLLDVARISAGRLQIQKTRIDVAGAVRRAVDAIGPAVRMRGQEVTLRVPSESLEVEADPIRLEQALGNLLNNASKFTNQGGHIWLTVEHAPGTDAADPGTVNIRVRDDGIGIEPELLPHVFGLFTQGDRSLARSQGGLGIGLTIVERIVEAHGGRVAARSAGQGQGTEFEIRLPLARRGHAGETAPETELSVAEATETPARRVLIVDDSIDSAETLARLLRADGHDVQTAVDGSSALRVAARFRPDIVLLDIGLPGMDGYEVGRQLRQVPGMADTLIVAVTGYGREQDRRRTQEAGFDRHLTKPVNHEALMQLLQSRRRGA